MLVDHGTAVMTVLAKRVDEDFSNAARRRRLMVSLVTVDVS